MSASAGSLPIKTVATPREDDPDARARLSREARAIASLNHPHICAIHDVLEADGQTFLVMEFIEGETLAARLARGPLPIAELLAVAIQAANALLPPTKRVLSTAISSHQTS